MGVLFWFVKMCYVCSAEASKKEIVHHVVYNLKYSGQQIVLNRKITKKNQPDKFELIFASFPIASSGNQHDPSTPYWYHL